MYANYFYDTSVIFNNSIITYREPFTICIGHDRRTYVHDVIGIDWGQQDVFVKHVCETQMPPLAATKTKSVTVTGVSLKFWPSTTLRGMWQVEIYTQLLTFSLLLGNTALPSKNNPNASGYFHVNFILCLIALLITQSAHCEYSSVDDINDNWYLFKY